VDKKVYYVSTTQTIVHNSSKLLSKLTKLMRSQEL